jgi:magnesium-transporting ATPase (P-type)
MVFNFVVLYELILVFIIRTGYHVPLLSNKWIWFSVVISIGLQALLLYTPLHTLFKIVHWLFPRFRAFSPAVLYSSVRSWDTTTALRPGFSKEKPTDCLGNPSG